MNREGKLYRVAATLEIVVAAILFVSLIFTCGLYIDIKMNGKTSSLPALSDVDKKMLLRSSVSESITYSDDRIEPVFYGVKNKDIMIAACPDDSSRRAIESIIYDSVISLFSGTAENIVFETQDEKDAYIENLKYTSEYMLVCYYDDLPSTVFQPCMSNEYDSNAEQSMFYVKNLFLLSDIDGNLFGIAISGEKDVNVLRPKENITFNNVLAESYDISDGYSYFEYAENGDVTPILTSSFMSGKYRVRSTARLYGKEKSTEWVNKLFDVFSINAALVKEYSSKNGAEKNYVEEAYELVINDDGNVEFKCNDSQGINIEEYLGFLPDDGKGYTFGEKIAAIKNIVNSLSVGDGLLSYSVVGVEYDNADDSLFVYLKSFAEGIMVSEAAYDAFFEISGDYLVKAKFSSLVCEKTNDLSVVLPQKYTNILISDENADKSTDDEKEAIEHVSSFCPILRLVDGQDDLYALKWARITPKSEVSE